MQQYLRDVEKYSPMCWLSVIAHELFTGHFYEPFLTGIAEH